MRCCSIILQDTTVCINQKDCKSNTLIPIVLQICLTRLQTKIMVYLHHSLTSHCPCVSTHHLGHASPGNCSVITSESYNMMLVSDKQTNMWQSRVEIEGYSVAYFDRIAVFGAPYRWTSVTCFVDVLISMKRVWAPPLTEVQRYGA